MKGRWLILLPVMFLSLKGRADECLSCHTSESLLQKGNSLSQMKNMRDNGEGVKTIFSLEVRGMLSLRWRGVKWKKRGRHIENDMKNCSLCHRYHGEAIYPIDEDPCSGCHSWLSSIDEKGFGGSGYSGSIRPEDLLKSGPHSRIFKRGFSSSPSDGIRIQILNPGCRGCHNLLNSAHGAITECTDCHIFSGKMHERHNRRIEETQDKNDPGNNVSCVYCHPGKGEVYRASCYNCHLSGHNPSLYYWKVK